MTGKTMLSKPLFSGESAALLRTALLSKSAMTMELMHLTAAEGANESKRGTRYRCFAKRHCAAQITIATIA